MFEPNKKLIKCANNTRTPSQVYIYNSLTKRHMPAEIVKVGGADIAIQVVLRAVRMNKTNKAFDVGDVLLPEICFATTFNNKTGAASLASVPGKFRAGIKVGKLSNASRVTPMSPEARRGARIIRDTKIREEMEDILIVERGRIQL